MIFTLYAKSHITLTNKSDEQLGPSTDTLA